MSIVKLGLGLASLVGVGILLNSDCDDDEKTVSENSYNTDNKDKNTALSRFKNNGKTDKKHISTPYTYTENETVETDTTPTQKRGEIFTCPDTGERLQVRAVGGRPRKDV